MTNISSPVNFSEPWLKFSTPIVRQLAFCISSPNIISKIPSELEIEYPFELHSDHFWSEQYNQYQQRLIELDQNPTELIVFLESLKSTRLGLRFEYLLWFWLQDHQYHSFKLLGHSIQIIQGAHTLGEIDFLILNTTSQQIEHWEVALKYYLAENDFDLKSWYGLNRSDTLHKKLNHFTHQQFQFNHVNNHSINKRFSILKGQLYLPRFSNSPIPNWVNTQRRLGTWGSQPLFEFYRLKRSEWICPDPQHTVNSSFFWTDGLYHACSKEEFYMFRNINFMPPYC
nr:DUF1853 family protein [Acinetobacter sp. Marseille-Q1620]